MPVRTPVGSIGGMDRLQHSQQSSVRKPTQTPAERRQSCRFHSRRESIPDTARIPPDRCEAAEDRRIRLPAAATSAEVTPYSTAAYSESESAMGKGIAFRLTTCAKKSSIAERESIPRRSKIGLAAESRERDRRMVLVEVAGMSQSDADCASCQLRRSRRCWQISPAHWASWKWLRRPVVLPSGRETEAITRRLVSSRSAIRRDACAAGLFPSRLQPPMLAG